MTNPNESSSAARLETDGKRSPMSYPGHPAYELMKGKNDTEIERDVKAMVGGRTPGELFLKLMEYEAVFTVPGDAFYRAQEDLAAVMHCSTRTISRAAKGLKPLIVITRRPRHPGSNSPKYLNYYQIDWNLFLSRMSEFYAERTAEQDRAGDKMSGNKRSTVAEHFAKLLRPGRQSPYRKRAPKYSELTNEDYAAMDRMYVEEAGMYRGYGQAGEILEAIRTESLCPKQLAEQIVRMKFDYLPEELVNWLARTAPAMERSDFYRLAEATWQADFTLPLDVIKRYEAISRKDDELPKVA